MSHYRMNPAEDRIIDGTELAEGMLVLCENWTSRQPHDYDGEDLGRQDQFRKVTKLRHKGELIVFLGEWDDGYQETHTYHRDYTWLAKKEFFFPENEGEK